MVEAEFNAADEDVVRDTEKKILNTRKQAVEDLRDVLKTPQGLRVFAKLLADSKLFQTTFTGSSHSYFNEGWRAFGLKILSDVTEAAPTKLNDLLIEKKDEVKK